MIASLFIGTTPNTSAGGISLEEEIVEVDVAEETDAVPNADAEPDTADVNITTVNAVCTHDLL